MQDDDLALDRVGIDGAAVFALVQRMNITNLQVPFLDVRTYDTESTVVHDPSLLVRQRDRVMVQPRYLLNNISLVGDSPMIIHVTYAKETCINC